jgi:hypothetical protein
MELPGLGSLIFIIFLRNYNGDRKHKKLYKKNFNKLTDGKGELWSGTALVGN